MFDVASSEVIILGVVALLVIPPKDLPKAMRSAGYWIGRVRGVATQFRSGFDSMLRESELHEMEKKWAEENERIMREHPPTPVQMLPSADAPTGAVDGDGAAIMVEQPALTAVPDAVPPEPTAEENTTLVDLPVPHHVAQEPAVSEARAAHP